MEFIGRLIEYFYNGLIENINLTYFLILILLGESLKGLTSRQENGKSYFNFYPKLKFKYRYLVFVIGLLITYPVYLLQDIPAGGGREFITHATVTYALATSFYELISSTIFDKIRSAFSRSKIDIVPVNIDLSKTLPTASNVATDVTISNTD